MDSTRNIIIFILAMTSIVAITLTGFRLSTADQAALNEDVFNKRAILSSLDQYLEKPSAELSDEEVRQLFENKVEQLAIDMEGNVLEGVAADDIDMQKEKSKPEAERRLPLYIFEQEGKKFYILSVRGNGLWDEIWGTVALEDDKNTIAGVAFDHAGETPGLGAEIKDNPVFPAMFRGKEIYTASGEYTSVTVRKGGAKDPKHEVDGISGATVTADGVTEMMKRGIRYYEPYLQSI